MSVDVGIRDQNGAVLADAPAGKPVLTTDAYAKQLADADALIQNVIRSNMADGRHS
jgi:membrane fusion protein (multidrug efflux system)